MFSKNTFPWFLKIIDIRKGPSNYYEIAILNYEGFSARTFSRYLVFSDVSFARNPYPPPPRNAPLGIEGADTNLLF